MSVDAEFGLDAEDDPPAIDQLLDLRRPTVVDVGARVFADLFVVDVQVHQDAWQEARLGRFGVAKGFADHLMGCCGGHGLFPLVDGEQNLRLRR